MTPRPNAPLTLFGWVDEKDGEGHRRRRFPAC